MEAKSRIQRNKEGEQVYLDLLNNHFETVTYEKYPDAMMNLIFSESRIHVLGKNYRKEKISQRKKKKIYTEIIKRMRAKYGKYVNITYFKMKGVTQIEFATNLDKVFVVPGHGTLYGAQYHSPCGNIFFTSHSLERFEERVDDDHYAWLKRAITDKDNAEPTTVDIISGMILASDMVYGRYQDFCHLYLPIGILVMEDFGDVFIAKTFLSPDMVKPVKWYLPEMVRAQKDSLNSFADVMNFGCEEIEQPPFYDDMIQMVKDLMERMEVTEL